MSVQLIKVLNLNELNGPAYLSVIGTCQAITFVVAAFTFVITLLSEEPVSPSKPSLAKHYDRIISVVFEKGAAPAAIQAGYLVLFFAAPTDRFWIPFQFIARRLFFLSLLTLYINDGVRERRCVTFSSNTQLVVSSASGYSAAVNSSRLKPHNIGSYSSRDAHSENTFVQKGHVKGSSIFNISVTREVIEDSEVFPEK
ncbi:hypothetical protein P691DRAFT_371859 [Macrolepiota fuliginosa MF-IS2]|uniref:Uncharacterized protein n=1 Tax=Macrolepiota fuliginosa MF-IS2 TaxID=1400762 RepID=A0A9P5X3Y5_9AGAR|nr:hypothetical protein P691DRAFT_371859 [Macrolepiota fuliginosa MF-IS2]